MPAPDGGDDSVGVGGPFKGFGHLVGVLDEAIDGGLEVDDGLENAAFQSPLGEFGEEALHGVDPGTEGQHEVEGEALGSGGSQSRTLGCLWAV